MSVVGVCMDICYGCEYGCLLWVWVGMSVVGVGIDVCCGCGYRCLAGCQPRLIVGITVCSGEH